MSTITPYNQPDLSKKEQVRSMFDKIAHRYDFLNHFLSLGIDRVWRKKAIDLLRKENPKTILDIATGTGDFAIQALSLQPTSITGIDISEEMLEHGKQKISKLKKGKEIIHLQQGDSENLKFSDESFDAVTAAFGVRNFENLEKGLSEMYRVLQKGGSSIILEFSRPQKFPVKQFYYFYFKNVLPMIGKFISKDKHAYSYLPESVKAFPSGNEFINRMKDAGFINTFYVSLTFGIATVYSGKK